MTVRVVVAWNTALTGPEGARLRAATRAYMVTMLAAEASKMRLRECLLIEAMRVYPFFIINGSPITEGREKAAVIIAGETRDVRYLIMTVLMALMTANPKA